MTTMSSMMPATRLLSDKFVDMVFITRLTALTDKWFCKLIQ